MFNIDCKQASQLISKSLDRRLSWYDKLRLRWHLFLCNMCRNFAKQLKQLRQLLWLQKSQIEQDEQIRISDEAKQRIAQAINTIND